ncbi:putative membrane protein [Actinoplanes octamycinicus]|uniref:Putative membrane protein n=1 Tax=Actinoplanes octamycinicus TaxID=135948 RepID=A0A7W7H295_9ACTN|nr:hypothetical protein [Actinoplanes octamycinicus]MBB4742645.1 putative membrane protein [Actinoplanes octamycinicus]GIE60983.1 hypothetical protein Aoc01nite_63850 [Actinoplanes octamycinicus]
MIRLLLASGTTLVAAFVLAPAALLNNPDDVLRDSLGPALVAYWRAGTPQFPAALADLVDYWYRWHAIKVVISALMLTVFTLLAVALWRRHLHRATARYPAIGATVFAVLATGLLMLNIQATAVPVIALLSLLPDSTPGRDLDQALQQMRQALTEPAGSPALTALLGQAEHYHWIMAAMAATLTTATGLASALLWRRRHAGNPRISSMRKTLGIILALTASLLLLAATASTLSATTPADTLRAVISPS